MPLSPNAQYEYTLHDGRILALVDLSPCEPPATVRDLIVLLQSFPGDWKLEGLHGRIQVYLDDLSAEPAVYVDGGLSKCYRCEYRERQGLPG